MGLDMYLTKRTYVKNWNHMKPEERHQVTVLKGGQPVTDIQPERVREIIEEVAYWRKANAIHKWFVDNCQDGVDDCRDAYVSAEQLGQLRDLCRQVLDTAKTQDGKVKNGSHCGPETEGKWVDNLEDGKVITNPTAVAELLPCASGFFFGSTEYDGYYLDDVQETFDVLSKLLEEDPKGDYYYHSSW